MTEESAEIYRMNKLLDIENGDWERQLKQAVGVCLDLITLDTFLSALLVSYFILTTSSYATV